MARVSRILTERLSGKSLAEIGQAQDPPCSPQAIQQIVQRAIRNRISETVEDARRFELLRLDALTNAIYQRALDGDLACIDRVIAIGVRRAKLLGLDLGAGGGLRFTDHGPVEVDQDGRPRMLVEIINSPELERVRWLEQRSERLLELEGDTEPTLN